MDNFIYAAGSSSIGNIDSNYWGGYSPTSPDQYFPNVTFTRNDNVLTGMTNCPFNVWCGSGTDLINKSPQTPQNFSFQDCEIRYTQGLSYRQLSKYQEAYQTFREYIEICYDEYDSWRAFSELYSANSERVPDTLGKHPEFRQWLKKVLYYNTKEPMYYCADLFAMYASYLGFDKADGAQINQARAIARYIIDSTDCNEYKETLRTQIANQINAQYELWVDTVKDSIATPFDTTTPTIDELDLTIIRKSQGAVLPDYEVVQSIFDLRANPNPFNDAITIEYELSENTILNIEILDVLGREIYRTVRDLELKGKRIRTLDTKNWSEGIYFARITTSRGEAYTVKLQLQR
jgi:hypothetical protein